ncbi:MAG: carboxypeptidase-like regulatory domain-containing protein [Fibrobacterales bacterium]
MKLLLISIILLGLTSCTTSDDTVAGATNTETGGDVAGVVYDTTGAPVMGARIQFIPFESHPVQDSSLLQLLQGESDATGMYQIRDLPIGTYAVEITSFERNSAYYIDTLIVSGEQSVELRDTLYQMGALTVEILDSIFIDGLVYVPNTSMYGIVDTTNRVTFHHVPVGMYLGLSFENLKGFIVTEHLDSAIIIESGHETIVPFDRDDAEVIDLSGVISNTPVDSNTVPDLVPDTLGGFEIGVIDTVLKDTIESIDTVTTADTVDHSDSISVVDTVTAIDTLESDPIDTTSIPIDTAQVIDTVSHTDSVLVVVPPKEEGDYMLKGHIVDANGVPLAGAVVTVLPGLAISLGGDTNTISVDTTNANGFYGFSDSIPDYFNFEVYHEATQSGIYTTEYLTSNNTITYNQAVMPVSTLILTLLDGGDAGGTVTLKGSTQSWRAGPDTLLENILIFNNIPPGTYGDLIYYPETGRQKEINLGKRLRFNGGDTLNLEVRF